MLTGQMPFHSATIYGLLFQHVYTLPPSAREINPYVSEALAQITARALAKAPEGRFQSAGAMAEALEVLLVPVTNQLSAPLTSGGAIDARLSVFPSQQRVTSSQSAYGEQQTGPAAVSSRQMVGGGSSVAPIQARSKRKFRVNQIVYWLAAILTVAVLILRIFFLAVNGMQLNGPNDPITDNSGTPPYTGGEPGLMVSGSSASETSFVVTLVKLMIS